LEAGVEDLEPVSMPLEVTAATDLCMAQEVEEAVQ
jgi:hypothetical protein